MTNEREPLFSPDGELFRPSPLTAGPWSDQAQHGGPPAALLARALEACEAPLPMRLVRVVVELLRPVPLTPLLVSARVLHASRKTQRLEASLSAGGVEVARASGLRIRVEEQRLPDDLPAAERLPPPDEAAGRPNPARFGFMAANDVRWLGGAFGSGPGAAWFRLLQPVVAGETPSGWQRALAAADFANGVGWRRELAGWSHINPDLTVTLFRDPAGEWIGLRSSSEVDANGMGLTDTRLFDQRGLVGRSIQTVILEPGRPGDRVPGVFAPQA